MLKLQPLESLGPELGSLSVLGARDNPYATESFLG